MIIIKGDLYEFMNEKKIEVAHDSKCFYECNKDIYTQLEILIDIHRRIKEYRDNLNPRLGGNIGKRIQGYKNLIRKLEISLQKSSYQNVKNEFDIYIYTNGKNILKNIKNRIESIERNGYKSIIKRSIENYEICIGRCDGGSLNRNGEWIYLKDIKKMKYDLLEEDAITLLQKSIRKNQDMNLLDLINKYVNELNLGEFSYKYILDSVNVPVDILKVWNKYIEGKTDMAPEEYVNLIKLKLGGWYE